MNKVYKIYKIQFPNEKVYIGLSCNVQNRWRDHLRGAAKCKSMIDIWESYKQFYSLNGFRKMMQIIRNWFPKISESAISCIVHNKRH